MARSHETTEGKVEMATKTGATGAGAAMVGFWGLLFGLLFLVPVGGWIVGGIIGELMGTIQGWGVKDEFRSKCADALRPGTSALVVFVSKMTPDKGVAALEPLGGTLLRTSLSEEAEQEIQHAHDTQGKVDSVAGQADLPARSEEVHIRRNT